MFKSFFALAATALALEHAEADVVRAKLDALVQPEEPTEVVLEGEANYTSGTAKWTYYDSYPKCCPDCGNYDPNADKSECDDYSGCKYCGDFEDGTHESLSWVKSNNIVSFFDVNGGWSSKYKDKTVQLTKNGVTFNAIIKDTCADKDCGGCCTRNAGSYGFLIDMEYYTVKRNLGSLSAADGTIQFKILN